MLSTLTYAVRVDASPDQSQTLSDTCAAYLGCCNMVSETAWEHKVLGQKVLHQLVYRRLRDEYHVGAQMAQSSIIRVIGNYRTIKPCTEARGRPAGRNTARLVTISCGTGTTVSSKTGD